MSQPYCVIPEGQKANLGSPARTGVNGSLVVETLHCADGKVTNLADLFPSNQAPTVANLLADQTVPEDATCSF
jgi:hypothetical protein